MALIFGVLASLFALLLQIALSIFYPGVFTLTLTFLGMLSIVLLALTEEGSRLIFSRQYLQAHLVRHPWLSALFFGIGFSLFELGLGIYFWKESPWSLSVIAGFHIAATLLTFWWLRRSQDRTSILSLLLVQTTLHILLNVSLLSLSF